MEQAVCSPGEEMVEVNIQMVVDVVRQSASVVELGAEEESCIVAVAAAEA